MKTSLSRELLGKAAVLNGLLAEGSVLIRNGSHVLWAMPSGIVARVGGRGTEAAAGREVAISNWLNSRGLRTVKAVNGLDQPTLVDGYTVTWWELLPIHRPATPEELGSVLKELHGLPAPSRLNLPRFEPFGDAKNRLSRTRDVSGVDVAWVRHRMADLERDYRYVESNIPVGLIHGDAWQGNLAVTKDGNPVILDLEAFCVGPRYWDLMPISVDYADFARISALEYEAFVTAYGFDVTCIPAYRTLADIQELRWISYVIGKARDDPAAAEEAEHRISCMRDELPRPWTWAAF